MSIEEKLKYSFADIDTAVFGLADRIKHTIQDSDVVLYACILQGGVVFFADLIRLLPPGYTEYIRANSYDEKGNRGELHVHSLPDPLEGPKYTKIFLIDDICDSGITLSVIASQLAARFPDSSVPSHAKLSLLPFQENFLQPYLLYHELLQSRAFQQNIPLQ